VSGSVTTFVVSLHSAVSSLHLGRNTRYGWSLSSSGAGLR
jgi:hypothetical protein